MEGNRYPVKIRAMSVKMPRVCLGHGGQISTDHPTPRSVLPVSSRLGTPFGVQHGFRIQFTENHQIAGNSHQYHSKVRRQTEVDLFRIAAPGLSFWRSYAMKTGLQKSLAGHKVLSLISRKIAFAVTLFYDMLSIPSENMLYFYCQYRYSKQEQEYDRLPNSLY